MTRELPPLRTPLTYRGIIAGLISAWPVIETATNLALVQTAAARYGLTLVPESLRASRAAVRLAAAQIGIETCLAACENWNLAGKKCKPNSTATCWQYFQTTEYWTQAQLAQAKTQGSDLIHVLSMDSAGVSKCAVYPKHPACCFTAFESDPGDPKRVPPEAVQDHLLTLANLFPAGLAGLLTGDVNKFALCLQHGKYGMYYTAPESQYASGLTYRLHQELASVPDNDDVWNGIGDAQ